MDPYRIGGVCRERCHIHIATAVVFAVLLATALVLGASARRLTLAIRQAE